MLNNSNKFSNYNSIIFYLYILFYIVSFTNQSFAATTTTNDVIGNTLCNVVVNLTSGGIAKSVATIAIFAIGIGLFLGKVNWALALSTTAGVGIIFSATALINWITGGSISACTSSVVTS